MGVLAGCRVADLPQAGGLLHAVVHHHHLLHHHGALGQPLRQSPQGGGLRVPAAAVGGGRADGRVAGGSLLDGPGQQVGPGSQELGRRAGDTLVVAQVRDGGV